MSAISDGWLMMVPIEPDRFRPRRVQALLDAAARMVAPPPGAGVAPLSRRRPAAK